MSNETFFPEPPPEVDAFGNAVGGDVKAIYMVTGMRYEVQADGAILIQADTTCLRTISVLKQGEENPVYEVNVSKPESDESERSYRGPEGSDACRIFKGYLDGWEKGAKAKAEKDAS